MAILGEAPRAIEALRPNIARIVDDLLDAIVARGSADLVADFAYPLPASVIMDMLGVPRSDLAVMKVWSDDIALFVGIARTTPGKHARAQVGTREMAAYFRRLVAERRAAPRDDMISALIAAGLLPFLGEITRVITPMKLLELMTPNNPLLKRLMVSAPGTYNHSVVAANLAETAAEAVGANPVLARVGCYFHDIGKIRRPHFFVENQADIGNIHENLSPTTSSDILNAHVTEGVELLKQYHFPTAIREIVQQHQGTTVKRYFYRQALDQGLDVREDDFRYPGPRPRSKEAAIVMIADTIEASARTLKDRSTEGIRDHVHRMIQGFIRDGQLDDCDLSFRDLRLVEEAMSNMVVSIYHARIEYPAPVQETAKAGEAVDTTGGGHDGTLDADDKTIPLPRPAARPRPSPS